MTDALGTIRVIDVIDNPDGSCNIQLDVDDVFVKWFKKDQGLKRWSEKRFHKWFIKVIEHGIKSYEEDGSLKSIEIEGIDDKA